MWRSKRVLIALTAVAAAVGCASTNMVSVWKDDSAGDLRFQKVMVLAMGSDQAIRRQAEDAFVRALPKQVTGVASYTVLSDADMRNKDTVVAKVQEAGCDAAAVYRLVSVDTQQSYVPGTTYVTGYGAPYYGTFGGYWGATSAVVYEPGYLVEDQVIQIECNVYKVADGKIVWSGRSETLNPGSTMDLIDDVVFTTIDQMKADKVF
jgi:hypothetical protein